MNFLAIDSDQYQGTRVIDLGCPPSLINFPLLPSILLSRHDLVLVQKKRYKYCIYNPCEKQENSSRDLVSTRHFINLDGTYVAHLKV
jgi:hypothetical protein